MNVLVYSGPEVLQASLTHTLSTLRSILFPHYSVQTVTQQALTSQPWTATCALLVFPSLHEAFVSPSMSTIDSYLHSGGKFLGFGTAARYEARRGILGVATATAGISKEEGLRFFDRGSGSSLYPTFCTATEISARHATLELADGIKVGGVYHNRAAKFVGVDGGKSVKILAEFVEAEGERVAASVKFEAGKGTVILWAPNLEYSLLAEPVSGLLPFGFQQGNLAFLERKRREALCRTLEYLELKIPSPDAPVIYRPLPQFLASHPSQPTIVSRILESLAAPSSTSELSVFEDANDTFHFHALAESVSVLRESRLLSQSDGDPSTWQPKRIIMCPDGELPDPKCTPLFDLGLYFGSLSAARQKEDQSEKNESWGIGEALFYGEVITSTQTMFDKNPRFMNLLPTPMLSIASHQLSGRGRGSNVWLSPSGSLSMSLLLRTSLNNLPAQKLVFVQYLFGLAVVEACRDSTVLGEWGKSIRLKWPNDLFAIISDGDEGRRKIGGVLVNTSFGAGEVEMVIGCGVNVRNTGTVTSLAQLLPQDLARQLSVERTAAVIMAKFERMWTTFLVHRGSFDPFMDLYLERWLHSDQLVTLTTTTPAQQVRIAGITSDYGLLRTVPQGIRQLHDYGFIDLQPDGNSFDLMANMIKTKR